METGGPSARFMQPSIHSAQALNLTPVASNFAHEIAAPDLAFQESETRHADRNDNYTGARRQGSKRKIQRSKVSRACDACKLSVACQT
jgi:hypothetical protein